MARIRTIKPEFFTSEDVVTLSPLARLFYVALWCEADREGRLSWKPKTLKMRYLPGDSCDIDALSSELVEVGMIVLYEVDGRQYAEIPSFKRHQVINNKEAESSIPARVDHASSRVKDASSRVKDASSRVKGEGRKGKEGKGKEGSSATYVAGADAPASAVDNLPNAGEHPDEVDPLNGDHGAPPWEDDPPQAAPKPTQSAPEPSRVDVAKDHIFAVGVPLLTGLGTRDAAARSFYGRMISQHGAIRVAEVVDACIAAAPVLEPASWIAKSLTDGKRSKHDFSKMNYTKGIGPNGEILL
jgi:hypothetical protein